MSFLSELPFVRMAHRGASGYAPENTLPAFERAMALGTDALDLDVRATKDGHLVVFHDEAVDRTTNGHGRIADLTLAEIKALDAGWESRHVGDECRGQGLQIPTLEEVLALDDGELAWNLDICDARPSCVNEVIATIRAHHIEPRTLVTCAQPDVLGRVRERLPEVVTTMTKDEVYAFYRVHLGIVQEPWEPTPQTVLQIPQYATPDNGERMYLPTEGAIEFAHGHGLRVFVWTVNDRDAMGSLCRAGVDGIYTDFPDLLNAVLRREHANAG